MLRRLGTHFYNFSKAIHSMNIDTAYFEIDGLKIEWGTTLGSARTMVEDIKQFEPVGGWPNVRCKCTGVYGLAANECEMRAPFEDRPILQVTYELAPIKAGFLEKRHSPYLKQLEKVLGKASKTESLYREQPLQKEYASGTVVYSAKWLFDDVRISLSVYGGIRNEESGPCAAGLFIDYINEIKISEPYRQSTAVFESELSNFIKADISLKKYKLKTKQRPFRIIDYALENPFRIDQDNEWRACQMALYKRELYQTPAMIQYKLEDDEIGYFAVPELNSIGICNKWDMVFLRPDQENEIVFWDILPARGSGANELNVKELKIHDERLSSAISRLVSQIEKDLRQPVEQREAYDD